jgi:hypothetical protein
VNRDFTQEIERVVHERIEAKVPSSARWIVAHVMNEHADILGRDADWNRAWASEGVAAAVRKAVNRYRIPESDDEAAQLALPGYARLQRAYAVERNGEPTIVPLECMALEELRGKQAELRRMSNGLLLHDAEIDQYIAERWGAQAA